MKAKKSLGQNFLKSKTVLKQIVTAGEIMPDELVLEIGPGRGALTEELLACSSQVIAVEKDRELFEFLKEKFASQITSGTLVLVHGDILEFNTSNYNLEPKTYKIIANIPYNITGAILKKFLTANNQPKSMVLMLQHEVATRILARDSRHGGAGGKESILSISVKAYGEPKMIVKVDKRYFSPAPKVNSAVIAIKNISRELFIKNKIDEGKFWEIIKTGFAHKRKRLAGNLKNVCSKDTLTPFGDRRAEDLSLQDWISLVDAQKPSI